MARGKSGRVVLEIDPDLKQKLYSHLERNQQTMKEWFVGEAETLVYGERQDDLFTESSDTNTPNNQRDDNR